MVKCNHHPMFAVEILASCLESLGVKNKIVEGAIMIDVEALKKVKKSEMPHFVFMNYNWIIKCATES